MRGYYDLSCRPATFDIVAFLTNCKTLGADSVVFDVSKGFQRKKFSQAVAQRMFELVTIPITEYWGIPWSFGDAGDVAPSHMAHSVTTTNPVLKHFDRADGSPTITIRESIRNKHRDSNRPEWDKFAKAIGAVVIEDAYVKPISIEDRMALYRNSSMNYFCSNGPAALCCYSNLPCLMVSNQAASGTWGEFKEGGQFHWFNEKQRLFWGEDTYENLMSVHASICP